MANYRMRDTRFTAIYIRHSDVGKKPVRITRVPWELVRFNVDANPTVAPVIVPNAESLGAKKSRTDEKIYEDIWFVDGGAPYGISAGGKVDFGKRDNEGEAGEA